MFSQERAAPTPHPPPRLWQFSVFVIVLADSKAWFFVVVFLILILNFEFEPPQCEGTGTDQHVRGTE